MTWSALFYDKWQKSTWYKNHRNLHSYYKISRNKRDILLHFYAEHLNILMNIGRTFMWNDNNTLKEIWLISLISFSLLDYHGSCLPNGAWSNTQEIICQIGRAVREGSAIRAVWLWLSNVTLIEIRPPRCADTSNSRKGFLKRYIRGYRKRFSGLPEGDVIEVFGQI